MTLSGADGGFYVLRTGCGWEMLPHDLPPYSTVYHYFRRWQKTGVWQEMKTALRQRLRQEQGRNPQQACCDRRQLVGENDRKKGEVYGFDGGKLVNRLLRHLVVDTQGLLLGVVVTEANTQDRLGGVAVLMEEACKSGALQLLWVDQGYIGEKLARASASVCGAKVEVVKRSAAGFQVLPSRRNFQEWREVS